MGKSRGPYISGPIAKGTPFQQHYNSDGTPNYVLAVQAQARASKEANSKVSKSVPTGKEKAYEDDFLKELHEGKARLQEKLAVKAERQIPMNKESELKSAGGEKSDKGRTHEDDFLKELHEGKARIHEKLGTHKKPEAAKSHENPEKSSGQMIQHPQNDKSLSKDEPDIEK